MFGLFDGLFGGGILGNAAEMAFEACLLDEMEQDAKKTFEACLPDEMEQEGMDDLLDMEEEA